MTIPVIRPFRSSSSSSSSLAILLVGTTAAGAATVIAAGVVITATPFILAAIATTRRAIRQRHRQKRKRRRILGQHDDNDDTYVDDDNHADSEASSYSALYTGRVWHSRFQPARHSFTYPMIMMALDLEELPRLLDSLWPLAPLCMSWSDDDHLKNGEGLLIQGDDGDDAVVDNSILARVLRLAAQRTNHAFCPSKDSHHVVLLTNLSYFGYCFNPVSFYYIIDRRSHTLSAVVGEVSNTPWLEMQCYVLHPDSVDQVNVLATSSDSTSRATAITNGHGSPPSSPGRTASTTIKSAVRYLFPKTFHVSPFMEMHYWYDWTFSPRSMMLAANDWNDNDAAQHDADEPFIQNDPSLRITTAMRVDKSDPTSSKDADHSSDPLQFTATLRLTKRYSLLDSYHAPLTAIAPTLVAFPVFGVLTQYWIHYQAALLYFVKKVPFISHPGSTRMSAADGVDEKGVNWATQAIAAAVGAVDAVVNVWERR